MWPSVVMMKLEIFGAGRWSQLISSPNKGLQAIIKVPSIIYGLAAFQICKVNLTTRFEKYAKHGSRTLTLRHPACIRLLGSNLPIEKPRFIASHDIVQTPLPLLVFGEVFLADAESVLTV